MAAAAAAVTVSLTYVYAMNSFNSKVADVNERQAMYAKLSEIDQKARQEYVGEIDEQALTDAICAGYVAGLGDSGAKYYSAARYQEYRAGLTGRNVGVGVSTVQDEDGNMEIVDVLPGSAAEKAGLQAGDVVLAIDGREVIRLTYGEAVNKLDGTAGTTVELSVLRPAAEEGGPGADALVHRDARGVCAAQRDLCRHQRQRGLSGRVTVPARTAAARSAKRSPPCSSRASWAL